MATDMPLAEYLGEIRQEVCGRCVERPPGGPPCAPLGKECGVEAHLAALVDAIHEVRSDFIQPYLQNNRAKICSRCPLLGEGGCPCPMDDPAVLGVTVAACSIYGERECPCPMDYLAVLLVQAVETVDQRRADRS
jgi:hypothetical protein